MVATISLDGGERQERATVSLTCHVVRGRCLNISRLLKMICLSAARKVTDMLRVRSLCSGMLAATLNGDMPPHPVARASRRAQGKHDWLPWRSFLGSHPQCAMSSPRARTALPKIMNFWFTCRDQLRPNWASCPPFVSSRAIPCAGTEVLHPCA